MVNCKGRCATFPRAMRNGCKYGDGIIRCIGCDLFFKYEGLFCPCCGSKVRRRPRKTSHMEKVYIG